MDYLTNYYKNLCENLQEKIICLQKTLNEVQETEFGEGGIIPSSKENNNEDETKKSDPKAMKLGKGKVVSSDIIKEKEEIKEERIKKKPQHLPFEILDIDAPFEFGKTHFDPSDIKISGRHVRPDGSRGPEVHIPIHAFPGIHYHDVADHVEDFMKGRKSPGNPLFDAWYDQGGDSPTTILVDSSKVKPVRRS
jgi:hypothetical protein